MIRSDARQPRPVPLPEPPASDADIDIGTLFRLGLWGGAAAACLLLVAIFTRTDVGRSRIAHAYASITGPAEVADRAAGRDTDIERARMTETIRNLADDRDRLLMRMTALERNYEDVTGSIGKLAGGTRSPVDTPAAPVLPPSAELAPITTAPTTGATTAIPTPPELPEGVSAKTEFGVDIGGAANLGALRTAWDRIRRNHAGLLEGLRPIVAIRDGRSGQVELRLVVGPISNAAAAAKLCASLAAAGLSCQPTMFEGQRLALR
jgi:hypothetical protein